MKMHMREVIRDFEHQGAVCAVNVENHDTLVGALRASADAQRPVVLGVSVPVARYLGMGDFLELADLTARRVGGDYTVHLDHCETVADAEDAIRAGFESINYLNEGAESGSAYENNAADLAGRFGSRVAFEFVLGHLGHAHHGPHDGHGEGDEGRSSGDPAAPSAQAVSAFAQATRPDIVGFHCGSMHGMRTRSLDLDTELISRVSTVTGLPIVLHGSSGVSEASVQAAIAAGVTKINVETFLRVRYFAAIKDALAADQAAARKPRVLSELLQSTVADIVASLITKYADPPRQMSSVPDHADG